MYLGIFRFYMDICQLHNPDSTFKVILLSVHLYTSMSVFVHMVVSFVLSLDDPVSVIVVRSGRDAKVEVLAEVLCFTAINCRPNLICYEQVWVTSSLMIMKDTKMFFCLFL